MQEGSNIRLSSEAKDGMTKCLAAEVCTDTIEVLAQVNWLFYLSTYSYSI